MQTLVIKTENLNQLDILMRLAKELHLNAELTDSESLEKKAILKLAESSFSKDWSSEEDEVWTDFLNNKKDVHSR